MGIREDVLALAGDVESTIGGCYGCLLDKRGLCKAETDFDCNDEVCKFVAHRLREIVEHDECEVTTASAYDLLPEDEREALAWVREMGGVEAAKARMMPEGCEWPRYEDGELVSIGDMAVLADDRPHEVESIELFADKSCKLKGKGTPWMQTVFKGQCVKRPAVIAADGEPLEVGQTVWHVGNGVELTVIGLPNPGEYQSVKLRLDDGAFTGFDPDQLTHQRPVLDADGNRIEPAMDVWWVCEGDGRGVHAEKLHVESIGDDGFVTCSPFNGGTWVELEPSELYVKKPALDADGVLCREGDEVWEVRSHRRREIVGTHYRDYKTGEPMILCDGDGAIPIPATCVTHTKPEPPDSRQAVVNEIGDEMAARIDLLVSSGRWSDAD